jgi:hypothetical protein
MNQVIGDADSWDGPEWQGTGIRIRSSDGLTVVSSPVGDYHAIGDILAVDMGTYSGCFHGGKQHDWLRR